MCAAEYAAGYVWTHHDLRRHLRLCLNLDLDLDPNLVLLPALDRALFEKPLAKPFDRPNGALFGRSYGFKYRPLPGLVNPAPYRPTQPPGRPLGR